jgi:hypothetical protein
MLEILLMTTLNEDRFANADKVLALVFKRKENLSQKKKTNNFFDSIYSASMNNG